MALKLDILANTRQFTGEMKQAGASVEDVSEALDDMARDGDKAGDKLERSFRDIVQDAKKADKAVEKIGDTSKKGFTKASGAGAEFKEESLANFSEVTSSFDGSMSSIGELAQGTLGGVAANIPGIGIAAGVAALGIGAITTELTNMETRSKEIKDGIIGDFLEIGDALDQEAVNARVRDILGVDATRKEAELLADILDINVGQAALAMAGDFESAGVTVEDVMEGINNAGGNVDFSTWNSLKNTVESTTGAMEAGREAAEAQSQAQSRTAQNAAADMQKAKTKVTELTTSLFNLGKGVYKPKIQVEVQDNTRDAVGRIVRRINGQVASIQISAGVSGKQLL